MTSSHREPRLPKRAEELLDGWPAPSRDALEWEESANAVMARVRSTSIGSTPDELVGAPLPEEPGERGRRLPGETRGAAPSAAEPSLADIARAALSNADAATREVARDGLIAAELGRRNPPREAASGPRAVGDAASLQGRIVRAPEPATPARNRPPPPPRLAARAEPVAVAEARAHSELPAPPSRERRTRGGALFGGSALALAAAAAFYLSFARHEAPEVRLTASAEIPALLAENGPDVAKSAPRRDEAVVAPSAAIPEAPVATVDALASAEKAHSPLVSSNAPKEKTLAFHVRKETASSAGKLVLEQRAEAPSENVGSVAGAAQAPASPVLPTSERPSTGAVQAALGSVLTSARGCLAGQEHGALATITFEGRTGRVKSVSVDGSDPGSPADSCVRSALMGARLPPFSEPTFTAKITVRPL